MPSALRPRQTGRALASAAAGVLVPGPRANVKVVGRPSDPGEVVVHALRLMVQSLRAPGQAKPVVGRRLPIAVVGADGADADTRRQQDQGQGRDEHLAPSHMRVADTAPLALPLDGSARRCPRDLGHSRKWTRPTRIIHNIHLPNRTCTQVFTLSRGRSNRRSIRIHLSWPHWVRHGGTGSASLVNRGAPDEAAPRSRGRPIGSLSRPELRPRGC